MDLNGYEPGARIQPAARFGAVSMAKARFEDLKRTISRWGRADVACLYLRCGGFMAGMRRSCKSCIDNRKCYSWRPLPSHLPSYLERFREV